MKNIEVIQRKPGRPRAISEDRTEEVISLYKGGLGYRAIAREMMKQGLSVDWSTVRRVIKRWLSEKDHHNSFCSNCDTILPRVCRKNRVIHHKPADCRVKRWRLI